jgi:uncharacterized protein involved in exopolysaccharide biosynthesis
MSINEPTRSRLTAPESADRMSVLFLLKALLKYRYAIIGASLLLGFIVGVMGLLASRTYTARGSFIPESSDRGANTAAALAGQLGINLGGGGSGTAQSPEFYATLVRSRAVLAQVLTDTLNLREPLKKDGARSGTLLDIIGVQTPNPALREELGLRWLEERVTATPTARTGIVRVMVKTTSPELSGRVAQRILDHVDDFNRRKRRTRAAAERGFTQERVREAGDSLRNAEDRLRQFLNANRQYQSSANLVYEHDRLERDVSIKQQLYSSLAGAYEDARINEVRDTPVISVLERPNVPLFPDPRGLAEKVVVGLIAGGMIGFLLALLREMFSRGRESGQEDYRDLRQVWDETVADFSRPFARAKR